MLSNNRKMINYLPEFLRPHLEKLIEAEEPEIGLAWSNVKDFLANAYLFTAKEAGLIRLEKLLKITPKATDTLADRRFTIHALLMDNQIITLRTIKDQLDALCGKNGYDIDITYHEYTVKVTLELGVKSQFDTVKKMLEQRIPANMLILVALKYNTHLTLARLTHGQLAAYTHEHLRSGVLG